MKDGRVTTSRAVLAICLVLALIYLLAPKPVPERVRVPASSLVPGLRVANKPELPSGLPSQAPGGEPLAETVSLPVAKGNDGTPTASTSRLKIVYQQQLPIETWDGNRVKLTPEGESALSALEQKYADITGMAMAYRADGTIDGAQARTLRTAISDAFYRDLSGIMSRSEILDYLSTLLFGGALADEMSGVFAARIQSGVVETPLDKVFYFTQFGRIESRLPQEILNRLVSQASELLQQVSVAVLRGLLDDKLMRIQYRYDVTGDLPDGRVSIYKEGLDVGYNIRIWMLVALQNRLYEIVCETEAHRIVLARETEDWYQQEIGFSRNQAKAFSESPLGAFLHYYPGP